VEKPFTNTLPRNAKEERGLSTKVSTENRRPLEKHRNHEQRALQMDESCFFRRYGFPEANLKVVRGGLKLLL